MFARPGAGCPHWRGRRRAVVEQAAPAHGIDRWPVQLGNAGWHQHSRPTAAPELRQRCVGRKTPAASTGRRAVARQRAREAGRQPGIKPARRRAGQHDDEQRRAQRGQRAATAQRRQPARRPFSPFPLTPLLSIPAITDLAAFHRPQCAPMLSTEGIEQPSRQAPKLYAARRVKFGHVCGGVIAEVVALNATAQPSLVAAGLAPPPAVRRIAGSEAGFGAVAAGVAVSAWQ
jgi:hypothetical protein